MNDEIKYIDDIEEMPKKKEETTNDIKIPTWNIEPPFEIERQEDEL